MLNATENIHLSESIVLMCFCLASVLGNGTEMHHGGIRVAALSRTAHVKNCYFQIIKLLNILTFSSRAYQQVEMCYFVKWKYQRNSFQSVETIWISSACTFNEMEMHLSKF